VKVFGIIAAVVIVLLIIVLVTRGPGGHGPSRHILLINLVATVVLLTYMETFALMAAVAADPGADLGAVRNPSPALHAALALLLLLVATVLAVYKPRGMTRYGQQKQHQRRAGLPRPGQDAPPTVSRP
jgi:hypothetical protein